MQNVSASTEGRNADASRPLIVCGADVAHAHVIDAHAHRRAQLLYAIEGSIEVKVAGHAAWVLTPRAAVWVPGGVAHGVRAAGAVAYRSVFARADGLTRLPPRVVPCAVDALTRAIIAEAATIGDGYRENSTESRLLGVLHDRLAALRTDPLPLAMPRDPRARRVCTALLENPADDRSLAEWGHVVGASSRTLSRIFVRETGVGFSAWVQRMRLSRALDLLEAGASVTATALDLGYASVSAFCAAFRRQFGRSPGRYFH